MMQLFIVEGNKQHLDGGSMFGNAPKALWNKWIPADAHNRIPLACRCLLVRTPQGRQVLFETGIGAFFEPKLKERFGVYETQHVLLENLAALGVKEEEIDAVVLSHLHFDHAGGLLTAYGEKMRLHFPKARYYLGREHWARAKNPHIREQVSFIPQIQELLADSGRLVLIEGSHCAELDFGVRFHYSHGHTIGLMLAELELPEGPLVFVSDLVPGIPWVHLPIVMGYDRFPELTVDEKRKLFEDLHKRKGRLFFTHDPQTPVVKLGMEGNRYTAEPTALSH